MFNGDREDRQGGIRVHALGAASSSHHLRYIDALRGLAILLVIVVHVSQLAPLPGRLGRVPAYGTLGVQLFYTVSALTLALSMSNRSGTEQRPLRNFLLRRFFRIAPMFYATLAAVLLLRAAGVGDRFGIPFVSGWKLLTVVTFTNGFRPDTINSPVQGQWSINVEMLFYGMLPFLFPHLRRLRHAMLAWAAAMGIFLLSFPLGIALARWEGFSPADIDTRLFASRWFPSQLPIFAGGLCLFFILRDRVPLRRCVVPFLSGAVVLLTVRLFAYHDTFLTPVYGVAMVLGIALLARRPAALLVNRATVTLGRASYSAYLIHPLLLHLLAPAVRRLHRGAGASFAITLVATLTVGMPVSILLRSVVEKPFEALGRRVIRRLEERYRRRTENGEADRTPGEADCG